MAALDALAFSNGEIGWGIFMGLWGLFVVSTVDNIIRPYFIGSALPLILVFLGLLGGIAAFSCSACSLARRCAPSAIPWFANGATQRNLSPSTYADDTRPSAPPPAVD